MILSVLALAASVPFAAAQLPPVYGKLADDRAAGRLSFAPLSLPQRQQLLKEINATLAVWVHRQEKLDFYGSAADPFPVVQSVVDSLDTISDNDLNLKLGQAFDSIRDLHTVFVKPGPYRCFTATTGLKFEFVTSDNTIDNTKVVVKAKSTAAAIASAVGSDFGLVNVGDEVVSINGDTFVQWYNKNQFTQGAGTNPSGGQRRAVDALSAIGGAINPLPSDNSIAIVFRSLSTGQTYATNLTYASIRNEVCWETSSAYTLSNSTAPPPPTIHPSASTAQFLPIGIIKDWHKTEVDSIFGPSTKSHLAAPSQSLEAVTPVVARPSLTGISWGVFDPTGKNLGVIRLVDFLPKTPDGNVQVDLTISLIRDILTSDLKDTNAVVFDVRDNPGGAIDIANLLPQLFKPDFVPGTARYLRNSINYNLFVQKSPPTDSWHQAWTSSKDGDVFSGEGVFDTVPQANQYGQAYLRPMGVFTNGRCYSACDFFSAAIQDSNTGLILGEDNFTGAGGANVLQHTDLQAADPADFGNIPLVKELTDSYGQSWGSVLTVAIRQAIRSGTHKGQLIEDHGITSDVVVRASIDDVLSGTSTSQYSRIADALAAAGTKSGQNGLYFVSEPFSRTGVIGSKVVIPFEYAGLDELVVINSNGTVLGYQKLSGSANKTVSSISYTSKLTTPGNEAIQIIGNKAGKQVLKTNRLVKMIFPTWQIVDFFYAQSYSLIGSNAHPYAVYNSPTSPPGFGWAFDPAHNAWAIGGDHGYIPGIDSTLELFFTAPINTPIQFSYSAYLDLVPVADTFSVSLNFGSQRKVIASISALNTPNANTLNFFTPTPTFSVQFKLNTRWYGHVAALNNVTVSIISGPVPV